MKHLAKIPPLKRGDPVEENDTMNVHCLHALASKRWLHLISISFLFLVGSVLSGCNSSVLSGGPCEANPGPTSVPDLAVMGNSIYIVSQGTQSLSALRIRDGALEWRDFAPYRGILAAENDIVYVSDYEGHQESIAALQARNGRKLWSKATSAHVHVDHGLVYLSHSGTVTALNGSTGVPRWTIKQSSVSVLQVFAGVIYILDEQGQLRALRADSGTPLWQASLDRIFFYSSLGDNFLYLRTNDFIVLYQGVVYVRTDRVYALRASDGHLLWSFSLKRMSLSSLEVVNDMVYFLLDGQVVALKASDGKLLWQSRRGIPYLSLLIAEGILYASDNEGSTPNIIDAFQAYDGHLLWHHDADEQFSLHGLASQGSLLYLLTGPSEDIRQNDSSLIVLQGKSGKVLWRVAVRAAVILLRGTFLYTGLAGNSSSFCAPKSEDQITQFSAKDISRVWHVQFQGTSSSS